MHTYATRATIMAQMKRLNTGIEILAYLHYCIIIMKMLNIITYALFAELQAKTLDFSEYIEAYVYGLEPQFQASRSQMDSRWATYLVCSTPYTLLWCSTIKVYITLAGYIPSLRALCAFLVLQHLADST